MARMTHLLLYVLIVGAVRAAPAHDDVDRATVWQIGRVDGDTAGFALGPGGYRDFARDAFYVVGQARPEADWPYVQPGPVDAWAGNRSHTFTIMFGLRKPDDDSPYRLMVDLVDTQSRVPPVLRVTCNGRVVAEHATPAGASDRSIEGEPKAGRPHQFAVEIAGAALQDVNRLEITTISGCWVLYDAIRFEAPAGAHLEPVPDGCIVAAARPQVCLIEREGRLCQPVVLDVIRTGAAVGADCKGNGEPLLAVELQPGRQDVTVYPPAVQQKRPLRIALEAEGQTLAETETTLEPVRHWVIYLMHHTHLDIGYTHTQEDVERRQMGFLDQVLSLIRETDDYPPAAQFRWLSEGLWAVESYLKTADDTKRREFIDAVKAGRIGLDALYGNALTGLYSQEELFELVDYALRLREQYGVTIDSAMISDVPGYTWGLVPVLAQSGVRYLSVGPNTGHRIGHTRIWGDKPFYWVSPCGRYKILFWMAGRGYAWFHRGPQTLNERRLFGYLRELEHEGYPYDMVQLRYNIGGDNGPPDPKLSDFVRQWNEKYAYPKIVICTTSQMFHDFERRYGDRLPVLHGDFTPYWEDGAASTAADTAANRRAAEKLVQARTLWALLNPATYPDDRFYAAWRNAVLYDEHTWGAHNSISRPDHPFAKRQAQYKQQFALQAESSAKALIHEATAERRTDARPVRAVEVFNTNSWPRTDLVVLPAEMKLAGDVVESADGTVTASQRLSTGELAFLATDVPPLGSARFRIGPGDAPGIGQARADGATLSNGLLTLKVDERTGAIPELRCAALAANLVDSAARYQLNDYIYVAGRKPENQQRAESASVKVLDHGPLVSTLQVESAAPGTRKLVRRIRLIDGINRVDITNVIDKLPIREKEGVHFAFPLNVSDATVRMDMPWSIVRPEADQIPGACKNFFAVQRWVDVSNPDYGITLVTIDAPLVQMGAIRTDVPAPWGSGGWLEHVQPSATLFSYVMNNYWETNYKADQEGPTTFRYSIRPHAGEYDQVAATRFGIERHRPLIAIPAHADGPTARAPTFRLDAPGVIVSSIKPSREGQAWITRLYAASGKRERVSLTWPGGRPSAIHRSGPDEVRGELLTGPIELPAYGIVTLRIEHETPPGSP